MTWTSRLGAEFIGTFLLTFTIGCNILSKSGLFGVLSIAFSLMVMTYAVGPVSGGHFNPAVTTAVFLANKLMLEDFLAYIGVQLVAGCLGGLAFSFLFGKTAPLEPSAGFTGYQAGLVECLYTLMLCFVYLTTVSTKAAKGNQYFGTAIGFVIIAAGYGAGAVSGAALNPAVALGMDVTSAKEYDFGWCMVYWVAEFLGAALACGIHRIVHMEEYGGDETKTMFKKCLSEFLGTFFLTLTVGLCALGNRDNGAALGIGACLMCMIYALHNVSGAHFNPAVTITVLLGGRNKMTKGDGNPYACAAAYIFSQLLGGVVGGGAYAELYGFQTTALAKLTLGPQDGFNIYQACLGEAFFTFIVCFTVLATATIPAFPSSFVDACEDEYVNTKGGSIAKWEMEGGHTVTDEMTKAQNFLLASKPENRAGVVANWRWRAADMSGFCIGMSLVVGVVAVGGISGAVLNPAIAVGIEFASFMSGGPTSFHYMLPLYCAKNIEGAMLAALALRTTHIYEWRQPLGKEEPIGEDAAQSVDAAPLLPAAQSGGAVPAEEVEAD